jgi:hypothetical protein
VASGSSLPPGTTTTPSPSHLLPLQQSTYCTSPAFHATIPREPPQLDAVLESFKQSISQQWQSLVDSYFPTQTTPNATYPRVQSMTPSHTPAVYTPPVQNLMTRTQPAKRRFMDMTNPIEASSSRSAPTNREVLVSSERTGDLKRLRLRSPPGTPSLWAAPVVRKRGRPRGTTSMHRYQNLESQQTRTPSKRSQRISSIISLLGDSEDELTTGGGPARTDEVKYERGASELPILQDGIIPGQTGAPMEGREISIHTTEISRGTSPGLGNGADRSTHFDNLVDIADDDRMDPTYVEPENAEGPARGTPSAPTESIKRRRSSKIQGSLARKRRRSNSIDWEQQASIDAITDDRYISTHQFRTASQAPMNSRHMTLEEQDRAVGMESDKCREKSQSAQSYTGTTSNAGRPANRPYLDKGTAGIKRSSANSAKIPSLSRSQSSETQLLTTATPSRGGSPAETHSSGCMSGRRMKKQRSLLIQSSSGVTGNIPSRITPFPVKVSLPPSPDHTKARVERLEETEGNRPGEGAMIAGLAEYRQSSAAPADIDRNHPPDDVEAARCHGGKHQEDPHSLDEGMTMLSHAPVRISQSSGPSLELGYKSRDATVVHRTGQRSPEATKEAPAESVLFDIRQSSRFRKSGFPVDEDAVDDSLNLEVLLPRTSTPRPETPSRNPLMTALGQPRKSNAGRRPKPGWTVENDAKLVHMVTVQKLSWAAIVDSREFPDKTYGNLLHRYYKELGGPLKKKFHKLSNSSRECENCHASYIPSKRLDHAVDPLCISCSMHARMNEAAQRSVSRAPGI